MRQFAAHHKEGGTTLGVTNVLHLLLLGYRKYLINRVGQIINANLVEGETPIGRRLDVRFLVSLRVDIASRVQHPDVEALFVKQECQSVAWAHLHPTR